MRRWYRIASAATESLHRRLEDDAHNVASITGRRPPALPHGRQAGRRWGGTHRVLLWS